MKPIYFRQVVAIALLLSGCDGAEWPRSMSQQTAPLMPWSAMKQATARPSAATPDAVPLASLKPAVPASGIPVRPGRFLEWSFEGRSHPTRYRMGDLEVAVEAVR